MTHGQWRAEWQRGKMLGDARLGAIKKIVMPLLIVALLAVNTPGRGALAAAPGTRAFAATWERTDKPVADNVVARTWMWGPEAVGIPITEPYAESPGGARVVQYFDKSRMEITHPNAIDDGMWYVTNGLLVVEMVSGRLQTGDNTFEQRSPAHVNVAGDHDDPTGPTYATIGALRGAPSIATGAAVTRRVDRHGTITDDPSMARHNVVAAQRVQAHGIDHQVASPFWAFMNSSGQIQMQHGAAFARLFQNPFYATGLPITDAYWAWVKVGDVYRDVLLQCFERRCLTYTPGHPPEWQVEAGNVGLHYAAWRYGPGWAPLSPTPRRTDGRAMLIGVSGNAFPWEASFDSYARLLRDSNVGHARLELHWHYIQPTPGEWRWSLYDDLVNQYVAQGLAPYGMLAYSVGWASGGGGSNMVLGPPTDLDAWENYVFQTVNRYKDRIHAWEVWNEPDVAMFWNGRDGGDPVYYAEMLRRAYSAVKRADPSAIVLNGGVTGTARGANFLQRLLDQGAAGYLDVIGIHGYISDDGFEHNIYPDLIWPLISQARERAGKPLWVTEVGWNSGCSGNLAACGESEQALRLIRNMTMLFTIGGVEMVSVFQFKDPGNNPHWFGVVTNNAQERQAYTALQTLADRLTGLSYAGRVDRGAGVWALKFTGPERAVYVVWATHGDRVVTLDTHGYPHAFVHQLDGSWSYQLPSAGGIEVLATGTPRIVEVSN
ncbi:MAG TPA: hypothetical protein VMM78_16790 [Thermomicrobiales bacterium]|nr:hypothetical protein [Thermomicrobiales bacterium]